MTVVVGGVVRKNDKFLLVQEAQKRYHGKWNLPAGRLEFDEILIEGAKREIKEETGWDVEIEGICEIGNIKKPNDLWISVIFKAKALKEICDYDRSEILDVKWFTYKEILAMKEDLRSPDLILTAIENAKNGFVGELNLIKE